MEQLQEAQQLLFMFVLSMVPVIELRGAIPIGIGLGFDFLTVYVVCVLGNLLPVPFLIPFAGKILRWCATLPYVKPLFKKIIVIGHQKIKRMGPVMMGLFLFVAVPLPGTGAWTGCLIATLLQMPLKKALGPIAAGVCAAGIIMGVASYGLFGLLGL